MNNSGSRAAIRRAALVIAPQSGVDEMLRGVLEASGWEVKPAKSNVSALQAVEEQAFDIIVTSEQTSCQEDIQLLRHLRRIRPHVRMVILTGRGTREDVIDAMREHAFSYFSEPFSLDDLAHAVRSAMNSPAWDDGIELVAANRAWIRLFVRCDLETADRLVHFLTEIAEDLPENERGEVGMAFREILLNAMEHGGNFNPKEYLEISYIRSRRAVACRIKDPGHGFSLEHVRHAAFANPPEDPFRHLALREARKMRPGGYGVMIARGLVDELIYGEKGNDVILIKYLDSISQTAGSTDAPSAQ